MKDSNDKAIGDDPSKIRGRDIVVLSDDWDGLPNSTMHLIRCLLRDNRVFWMNMIGRMPRLSWDDASKALRIGRSWFSTSRNSLTVPETTPEAPRNPIVSNPFIVPWFKRPCRALNQRSLQRTFLALRNHHTITAPIVITSAPAAIDFVKSLDDALTIYYCVDEWEEYPGINIGDWRRMEEELLDIADGVVVTSRALARKVKNNKALLYLPQGVDYEHFGGQAHAAAEARDISDIPRPIVGFFGMISPWVDLGIIAALAKSFPNVSFVLIGKIDVRQEQLPSSGNIYYLGPVPYAELPRYACRFDIGLIPFVNSKLTRAVNPLKLMEYYALGLPVLATRLPEFDGCEGPIFLAETEQEFDRQLRRIFEQDLAEVKEAATSVARKNTWRHRAGELSRFLCSCEQATSC